MALRYDRAETLVRNIARYIHQHTVASLLDIGAGEESMAAPLSQLVRRYLAVEQDSSRAKFLQNVGLETLCNTFPLDISEVFDMVLSCHSVPEADVAAYDPFLEAAWKPVAVNGLLLVITFKGSAGDAAGLREEITGRRTTIDPQFEAIIRNLRGKGEVLIERVNSYLRSSFAEEILQSLNGWILRTDEEIERYGCELKEIIRMRYNIGGEYVFPMQHLFISTLKR